MVKEITAFIWAEKYKFNFKIHGWVIHNDFKLGLV